MPFDMGFIGQNGPLYFKDTGDGLILGTRVKPRHCNPMMIAHGGWLSTLLDMILPMSVRHQVPRFSMTMNLVTDYLGPAPVGSWIEGTGELLKLTKRSMFIRGLLSVEGEPVASGTGIFRLGPEVTDEHRRMFDHLKKPESAA